MACGLINQCIRSLWFSVVMNGVSKGFFPAGRGLRQGDPISPYLFIMVEEILYRMIKKAFLDGKILPFYHLRGTPIVSHLLYADDIVIFANGNKASMKSISKILELYEDWSGQIVSKAKSSFIFSKRISLHRRRSTLSITGFVKGTLSFEYLGIPIISRRLKAIHLDDLLRVKDCRVESGWDVSLIQRLIGERHSVVILRTLCNAKVGEDILVWTGNSDGKFSTHNAWDILRVRSPKVGIYIASKCDCCVNGGYEDQNHALAGGDFVQEIWKKAVVLVCLNYVPRQDWHNTISMWFGTSTISHDDEVILQSLNIPIKPPKTKSMHIVKWLQPIQDRVKLNVDGSSLGNLGRLGARRVIRDHSGKLIRCFAEHIGIGSSNYAEGMGLLLDYGL
ncbi:uncharacterized protein LOC118344233 [Juglans regia]|uniref:Uncharacterized protein LOC118344231 n=1 Tax=Juglans regia TaxID=51240 RepID=A0A6P9E7I2_JUGRE|nr:uncharacterized protein LOC118344231 [Juglans regia]XP_035540256.1 uncharacterized protein LOC118344233 [Juglans regia]